jgi:ABC-2 type transport system ATP-binding protein
MKVEAERPKTELRISDLKINYSELEALNIKKLDLAGRMIAVIGHNGAGKSTLIKAILRLLMPKTGALAAYFLKNEKEEQLIPELDMAFCPETGAVFADIAVESYVRLWCRIKHGRTNYYKKEGAEYIDSLNLSPLFPKLGRELSKGERRRVQTAIGFLCAPRLFLFDEPFDGLDVQKTNELADIIRSHTDRLSAIVSSHRMDVVERLADRVIVLKEGEVAAAGSVAEVSVALCGKSIMLRSIMMADKLVRALKDKLPNVLVNRVGERVYLTGEDLVMKDVQNLLKSLELSTEKLTYVQPGLVDAMNYHLSRIS